LSVEVVKLTTVPLSIKPEALELPEFVIVTMSPDASVVITIPVPAVNVRVSVELSATTSDCPLTEIVLNVCSVDEEMEELMVRPSIEMPDPAVNTTDPVEPCSDDTPEATVEETAFMTGF
jgi:hypothetical protein